MFTNYLKWWDNHVAIWLGIVAVSFGYIVYQVLVSTLPRKK